MDFLVQSALENVNDDANLVRRAEDLRIFIVGCGGAGNNSVDRLFKMGIAGAEVIALNTDQQHLDAREAHKKLLIGKELTRGLGAGGYPEVGRKAAEESRHKIKEFLESADLVFITAGMGGGTGTGCAPVVAEISTETGAIVIGVVTMPFKLEKARILKAEAGLGLLREHSDTVIVIDNNRLTSVAGNLPIKQAFAVADELIATMIKGIVETIALPSLVNLDYADVKSIMKNGDVAMIGVGESASESKARECVEKALQTALIDVDYKGGTGALIHITGGHDMTLEEANQIGELVTQHLDPNAQVIWGARVEDGMENKIRVMTIITGVKSPYLLGKTNKMAEADLESKKVETLGIDMIGKFV